MPLHSTLFSFAIAFLLFSCGSSHAPVTHAELAGKWEVVDVKIDSDYIDANPKFKQGVIDGLMGTLYTFSDDKFLTVNFSNTDDYGEYTLRDDGHTLSHNAGATDGGQTEAEVYLENGNLSLVDDFDDVGGGSSTITLVLRQR